MGRRSAVNAVDFVKVFSPLAKAGKSAFEIGQALGIKGDEVKVAQYVAVKASQLRKQLKANAVIKATEQKLKEKEKDALIAKMVGLLPRIKSKNGGKRGRTATMVNDVIAQLEAMDK